ncbi:MAG: zinc ribbon domain-containing protein [Gammaproteobacteria bacterium]|nr:zinc ribbon domain-containing protein [Gammaproteobacteria bacterium]
MAFCRQCGKLLRSGASFCTNCGAAMKPNDEMHGKKRNKANSVSQLKDIHAKQQTNTELHPGDQPVKQVNKRALIIKAATKGLAKSLLLSAVVLGPGIILITQEKQILGMLWLFVGSFGMMAWTYRKPWRLMILTCLLPPSAALISYVIQLILFGVAMPPGKILLVAAGAGLLVGYLRARSHVVFEKDGAIFAHRTTKYLVIWIIAFGSTQILGAAAQSVFLVATGLLTGAFTTAMLIVVSLVLLSKRASLAKSKTQ